MRWSDQPGYKVEVPRHFLETLAEQMADPEKWAYMLREHARTIRQQLALPERARGERRTPPGYSLTECGFRRAWYPPPDFAGRLDDGGLPGDSAARWCERLRLLSR